MKHNLVVFLLSSVSSVNAQVNPMTDSLHVKENIDFILKEKPPVPTEDSLLAKSLLLCKRAKLSVWQVRLLNFWSQQKVAQNDIEEARQLINNALQICEEDNNLAATVDYRDALVQKSLVEFYLNQSDSSLHWAKKGLALSHQANDAFNESIFTTQEANVYGITRSKRNDIDSMYSRASSLAQKTSTRHDDVMALHNYSYYLKTAPSFNLKKSMEIMLSMQDYSQDDELDNYRNIPYRRAPFFYRGAHLKTLQELSLGYYYLEDLEQAIEYADMVNKKIAVTSRKKYSPYTLIYRTFLETYSGNKKTLQHLLDSTMQLFKRYHGKDELPVSYYYYVRGWLAEESDSFSIAIKYYTKAIDGSEERSDISENQIALFRVTVKTGNISQADSLYHSYITHIDSNITPYYKIYFYKVLPTYFRLKKMESKALEASLRYYQLKDSLGGVSKFLIASRFEKQFKTKEKDRLLGIAEKEKELQQKQLSLRNKQAVLLITALLTLCIGLVLLIRNYRAKQKQALVLEEKNKQIETLVRELHHRVKNNLQVVSSLMSLQSKRVEDDKARLALEEGRTRVDAMAMIHQKLYMDNELASVDMQEYLQNLSLSLAHSYGYSDKHIETIVQLPEKNMDIDLAIPVGLIVNELLSNVFKHAFTGITNPLAKVEMIQNDKGQVVLSVEDNGSGIADTINLQRKGTFGMKLVNTLVQQLNASMHIKTGAGTKFIITMENNKAGFSSGS